MLSRSLLFVLVVGVIAGAGPAISTADEVSKFVGTWKGKIGNYDEIWTV